MNLWRTLRGDRGGRTESRFTVDDYFSWLAENGNSPYTILNSGGPWQPQEEIETSFVGYVQGLYKSNGVVFACQMARQRIFNQARFKFADVSSDKLFGGPELRLLEKPWPNGSSGELMSRMIQDADLAGQPYIVREKGRVRRLRPDWVSIILTAPPAEAIESDVAGYLYRPGGVNSDAMGKIYLPDEIAHWTPIPDPEAQYRGMSWLTPVIREIQADKSATLHKLKFFDNAATPSLAVSFKETVTDDQFDEFMRDLDEAHGGVDNAYKTLYLAGGADVTVVGADLKQLDFKVVQGAGETRIANAAGVPAVIVGLSEGLSGSSLNAGNYNSARRNFAEGTLEDLWRGVCASLETIVPPPDGSYLAIDKRKVPFLREDAKDIAEIQFRQAQAIRSLMDGGMQPDAAVEFVMTNDLSSLIGHHSGLFSVQLQPPGAGQGDQNQGSEQ